MDVRSAFLLPYFIEISVFIANCVDPDLTPRSLASDLDLHCLPTFILLALGINGLNFVLNNKRDFTISKEDISSKEGDIQGLLLLYGLILLDRLY